MRSKSLDAWSAREGKKVRDDPAGTWQAHRYRGPPFEFWHERKHFFQGSTALCWPLHSSDYAKVFFWPGLVRAHTCNCILGAKVPLTFARKFTLNNGAKLKMDRNGHHHPNVSHVSESQTDVTQFPESRNHPMWASKYFSFGFTLHFGGTIQFFSCIGRVSISPGRCNFAM